MVRIEAFSTGHLPAVLAATANTDDLAEYGAPWWRPRSEAEIARKISSQAGPALALEYNFVILRDTGEVIGECSVHTIDYRCRVAQLGIIIWAPQHRTQGHGSGALAWLTSWATGSLGLRRLEAWVIDDNTASLALFTRAGFAHEGTLTQRYLVNGTWRDQHILARLHP